MSRWKTKEEYEAWKTKNLKPTESSPSASKKNIKKRTLIIVSVLIIILIPLTYYLYSYIKERIEQKKFLIEYEIYKKDAFITLNELNKISAAIDIGITFLDYNRKLGEINHPIKIFLAKYEVYNARTPRGSYQAIENIRNMYQILGELWQVAINSGDSYTLSLTKQYISQQWSLLSEELKLVDQILKEGLGPRAIELRDNLNKVHSTWFKNSEEYYKKIDLYKDALEKYEKFSKEIKERIEDIRRKIETIENR